MSLEAQPSGGDRLTLLRQRTAQFATLGERAQVVVDGLVRELQVDVAIVRRRRGAWFNLLAASGIEINELPPAVAASEGMAAQLVRGGQTLVIEDVSNSEVTRNLHSAARGDNQRRGLIFRSCATTPLKAGDRVVGLMGIYSVWDNRRFPPEDLAFLEAAAALLAQELAIDDRKNESSGGVQRLKQMGN